MTATGMIRNRELAHFAAHLLESMTGDKVKVCPVGRAYRLLRWAGREWVNG